MLTPHQLRKLRHASGVGPNKLRLAIELADTTQVKVAAAIGIAQSQVSEDVTGKSTDISLQKARAYARVFGCEVEDLFPVSEAVAS